MLKINWPSERRESSKFGAEPQKIIGYRHTGNADIPFLENLIRPRNFELFGNFNLSKTYEKSCLSVIQYNRMHEIVSGIFICNYPNVPSLPSEEWVAWLRRLYGLENINERNSMFIHLILWDDQYTDIFFEDLLNAIFDIYAYCTHLLLVLPPQTTSVNAFEQHMIKVMPKGMANSQKVQAVYLGTNHQHNLRLRIRRAVEEDNDDVVAIIDSESTRLKELYGDYYISEMIRHPDGCRQLIVSEDEDALTGVMCINSTIDLDLLNEIFELGPYNGLRIPHESDYTPTSIRKTTSEILLELFDEQTRVKEERIHRLSKKLDYPILDSVLQQEMQSWNNNLSPEMSKTLKVKESSSDDLNSDSIKKDGDRSSLVSSKEKRKISALLKQESRDASVESKISSMSNGSGEEDEFQSDDQDLKTTQFLHTDDSFPGIDSYEQLQARQTSRKLRISMFADTITHVPRMSQVPAVKIVSDVLRSQFIRSTLTTPGYYGTANAFVIELFVMKKRIRERRTQDFLEAAFECFPDLDYCAILMPFGQPSLKYLDNFLRVPLRCHKDFPMTLYIVHKAVLLGDLSARECRAGDTEDVMNFLKNIPNAEVAMKNFQEIVDSCHSKKFCYIFQCNDSIIGLSILSLERDFQYLSGHYHVEDYVVLQNVHLDAHGRILNFFLMPIFAIHHRFFFREIMRLSQLTVIYYRLYEADASALTRSQPLAICLNAMMPVRPRQRIQYEFLDFYREKIDGSEENCDMRDSDEDLHASCTEMQDPDESNTDIKSIVEESDEYLNLKRRNEEEEEEIFSLYMTTPRLTIIPNPVIDIRIVVVGASDCGLAFTEYLALGITPNFTRFTNLTLISPNGLQFDRKLDDSVLNMLPFKGRYCRKYGHLIATRTWVNLIYGTVVKINRTEKYVTILDQGNLTYDYLILTCGLQYQKPILKSDTEAQIMGEMINMKIPWNCLTVNDDTEALTAIRKVNLLTNNLAEKKSIVFYGHNTDCYCALNGLLKLGVPGAWITLIEPSLNTCETHDYVFFNDSEIDITVMEAIRENGIMVLSEWNVVDWNLQEITDSDGSDNQEIIKTLLIESRTQSQTISCDILFCFSEKFINMKTFLAISQAGLVFDGHLIINTDCQTNDPFIFAGGTITKYSRKYSAEFWQHRYCNSIEVGEKLARIFRNIILDRQADLENATTELMDKNESTSFVFQMARVVSCILPGNYHYLHVYKPGKQIMRKIAIGNDFYGDAMITGSCKSDIGYFRIHFNEYETVETVTCFSKQKFEVQHMIALYGKHESLLNSIKIRFLKSQIVDLFAYFRESWAALLFHDRFDCLRAENRAILLTEMTPFDSLVQEIGASLIRSNWESMSDKDREYIESTYSTSFYQQAIQSNVMGFIEFSSNDLPMYCTSRKVHELYGNVANDHLLLDDDQDL